MYSLDFSDCIHYTGYVISSVFTKHQGKDERGMEEAMSRILFTYAKN